MCVYVVRLFVKPSEFNAFLNYLLAHLVSELDNLLGDTQCEITGESIRHFYERPCLTTFLNTDKRVENTTRNRVFLTNF